MSAHLEETLKARKLRDISGKVFPIAVRSLGEAFSKGLRKAESDDFRFHDLRQTFGYPLVQNGMDLKELFGHKSVTLAIRYAHLYPESLRDSVEVLDLCSKSVTFGDGEVDRPLNNPLKHSARAVESGRRAGLRTLKEPIS
jgi:hypothetical protein